MKTEIWERMRLLPQRSEHGTEDASEVGAVGDTRVEDNWEDELRQAYEEGLSRSQKTAEDLIRRVSNGHMTPGEADLEANSKLNLTLSQPLELFDLRAGHMYLWSPEMVAAWIIWRRSAHVLRHYEPSYSDAKAWVKNATARSYYIGINGWPPLELPVKGHQLVQLEKTSIGKQFLDHNGELCSFNRHWESELQAAMVVHGIRSFGLAYESGQDTEIPSTVWKNGALKVRDGETVLLEGRIIKYRDIRFIAADVLKAFEPDYGVFRPWKREPKKLDGRDEIAVNALRKEWPHGFPWHWSGQEKFEQVMNILNAAAPRRFNYKENNLTFQKFLQRLAVKALEEKVDSSVIL